MSVRTTVDYAVDKNSHTIAAQIVYFRLHRGMTQQQVADLCGMKQSSIARLERTPDIKWRSATLMRVAAALDLHVSADVIPNEDFKPLLRR